MHTQTHLLVNLGALDRDEATSGLWVAAGAVVPDSPMFLFYAYQKFVAGRAEEVIWNEVYFDPSWQAFIDAFNSLPLAVLGALVGRLFGVRWAWAFFASAALHIVMDLPVHTDDAHAHLWPISDWKFHSPVSYWDPAAHGHVVAGAEAVAVAALAVWLYRRYAGAPWARAGVVLTAVSLVALYVVALAVWM